VFYQKEDFDTAITHFSKALEAQPESSATINDLACCYYSLGNVPDACSMFKEAIKFDPSSRSAYCNLGFVATQQNLL